MHDRGPRRRRQQTCRVGGLSSVSTIKPLYRIGEGEASLLERPCINKYATNNLRAFWTEIGGGSDDRDYDYKQKIKTSLRTTM